MHLLEGEGGGEIGGFAFINFYEVDVGVFISMLCRKFIEPQHQDMR